MPASFASDVSEVTMPPRWSPGVALSGTARANGTCFSLPGLILTVLRPAVTQTPTPWDSWSVRSRSSWPSVVVNPSAAYTARVIGSVPSLWTTSASSTVAPGLSV